MAVFLILPFQEDGINFLYLNQILSIDIDLQNYNMKGEFPNQLKLRLFLKSEKKQTVFLL
jgi:hypothetical protein